MGASPDLATQLRGLAEATTGTTSEHVRRTGGLWKDNPLGHTLARTRSGLKHSVMGLAPKGGQMSLKEGGSVNTPSIWRVIPEGAIWGALGLPTPLIWRVIPQGEEGGALGLPTRSSAMPPRPPTDQLRGTLKRRSMARHPP